MSAHEDGQSTVVVHTGGVGDFLLACPALQALSQRAPLTLMGNPDRLALARLGGMEVDIVDMETVDFHTLFSDPSGHARECFAGFDRAIVWMNDADGAIRRGLAATGIDEVETFSGLPPADWRRHASAYYLECLGLQDAACPFCLSPPQPGAHYDVIIHPGSGGAHKNWPVGRFSAVTDSLLNQDYAVAWALGPAERGVEAPAGAGKLSGVPLPSLASMLSAARLYIGNDSGITHLAAAAACPVVALFGPTDANIWAPRGLHIDVMSLEMGPEQLMKFLVRLLD
ncbi:MAG: glycosyltransferase family 9 protein [Candidatus Hydrogenedentes bacterium]|nr:glycosyltransferase family 9 protein [Candidatus Hydrogenedentota bacterium]